MQFSTENRHLIYLNKTFCSPLLKFHTPRTVLNSNYFIYIYIYYFCVEDKKYMFDFSI